MTVVVNKLDELSEDLRSLLPRVPSSRHSSSQSSGSSTFLFTGRREDSRSYNDLGRPMSEGHAFHPSHLDLPVKQEMRQNTDLLLPRQASEDLRFMSPITESEVETHMRHNQSAPGLVQSSINEEVEKTKMVNGDTLTKTPDISPSGSDTHLELEGPVHNGREHRGSKTSLTGNSATPHSEQKQKGSSVTSLESAGFDYNQDSMNGQSDHTYVKLPMTDADQNPLYKPPASDVDEMDVKHSFFLEQSQTDGKLADGDSTIPKRLSSPEPADEQENFDVTETEQEEPVTNKMPQLPMRKGKDGFNFDVLPSSTKRGPPKLPRPKRVPYSRMKKSTTKFVCDNRIEYICNAYNVEDDGMILRCSLV